jgi:hypothetical protein
MTAAQQQLVTEACLLLSVLLEGDLSLSGTYNTYHDTWHMRLLEPQRLVVLSELIAVSYHALSSCCFEH